MRQKVTQTIAMTTRMSRSYINLFHIKIVIIKLNLKSELGIMIKWSGE